MAKISDKLQAIADAIDETIRIAQAKAAAEILAESSARIFNSGLAKDGSQIGKYSPLSKELRKEKGLQTAYVDLFDTGALSKSISNSENKVFFKNDYGKTISTKNEKHFKKRVFAPSKSEAQIFVDILRKDINELIR